ncbi:hypothetical protein T12_7083 [Trichinella patagoniensis]|uniref:Uncharacterized protein n=1 Tax=Trichinella patagoniensis TaxID=990121 RepID=A0A0V1AD93_9BILA|nr:hypothetical protein T12_7083 [Trichinella patagoniensis]
MNSAAKRAGAKELMNSDAPAEMVIKTSVLKNKLVTSTASIECASSPELKRKGCMATALGMVDLHEEIILRVPSSRIVGVHDQLEQYPCLLC